MLASRIARMRLMVRGRARARYINGLTRSLAALRTDAVGDQKRGTLKLAAHLPPFSRNSLMIALFHSLKSISPPPVDGFDGRQSSEAKVLGSAGDRPQSEGPGAVGAAPLSSSISKITRLTARWVREPGLSGPQPPTAMGRALGSSTPYPERPDSDAPGSAGVREAPHPTSQFWSSMGGSGFEKW